MTRIELRYGRSAIAANVPKNARITWIRKPAMPCVADPALSVRTALGTPVCGTTLRQLAAVARSVCIAICDVTRPVPNRLFLRPMIETMMAAGVSKDQITVLVATGLHRPNEGDELAELVGDSWVFQHANVVNHIARNDHDHVTLGCTSSRGTVVRLDRRFVQADLRIVTGLVEPHFMAGYSGGRKVIAPGLAHAETITTFHNAQFMQHPAARNCNLDDNPLHEEQLQIVRMLGDVWALNTVIDEDRQLAFVNFGEVVSSHQQAIDFARRYCEVIVNRQFATVVTCGAGYPLDKTYYQAIKGMVGAVDILAPGGDLIVASECSEGLGSPEFIAAQRRLLQSGPAQFLKGLLAKSNADIDEWQTQQQLKPMAVGNVHLFASGLSASDHRLTGVNRIESLDQAIAESLVRNPNGEIAVIPEGPYVVPFFRRNPS